MGMQALASGDTMISVQIPRSQVAAIQYAGQHYLATEPLGSLRANVAAAIETLDVGVPISASRPASTGEPSGYTLADAVRNLPFPSGLTKEEILVYDAALSDAADLVRANTCATPPHA